MTHKKVALVTGGADRIGAQTARRLHEAGFDLAIHFRNSSSKAERLQESLNQQRQSSASVFQADLVEGNAPEQLIGKVVDHFGRLDVLINNASSYYPTPIGQMNEANWNDLVGSNMKAPLFLAQAAAPHLKASQGCIVNLVDIHGFRPIQEHTIYSMAKAANIMMVKSLARELAPDIRVNGVAPGAIAWPDADMDESTKQSILQRVPLQRKGEFDDIARTIRFLVTDAQYITGQVIAVDGGRTTQQ